jgi:aminoglycoside phosphotransferase (APT) family kinase protein
MGYKRDRGEAGWRRAADVLVRAMRGRVGSGVRVEFGRVVRIGSGLSRDLFGAHLDVTPDPDNLSGSYVAMLPRRDAVPGLEARTHREAALLQRLVELALPFRVPHVLGIVAEGSHSVLVREFLPGIPLEFRAGNQPGLEPWDIVGRVAAAVHSIKPSRLRDVLAGHASAQEHRRAELDVFNGLPGVEEAAAWAQTHVGSSAPAVVLHGDLLGQNILLSPETPPAVMDWEYATLGDPAYDLAIVTRGVRQPFQVAGGLERLLEAYAAAGGAPVTVRDVRFHEICLAAGWYRDALAGEGADPPDQARQRLLGILRRAKAARD